MGEIKKAYEIEGQWFAERYNGEVLRLQKVPRGKSAEHYVDTDGNVIAKRCTKCGTVKLATLDNFRADSRRFVGQQSKCKSCHAKMDAINRRGLSIKGGPKKSQKARATRFYDEQGVVSEKVCPCCGKLRKRAIYREHSGNHDGLFDYCRICDDVAQHNKRAKDRGLPATLTWQEWETTLNTFGGKCALTGAEATMDHVISLSNEGSGTTAWNCIPLSRSLNCSKRNLNLFDWLEKPHVDAKLDPELVDNLLRYLASMCDLTVTEYRHFYNWTFTDKGADYIKTGLSSLEYYKLFVKQARKQSEIA